MTDLRVDELMKHSTTSGMHSNAACLLPSERFFLFRARWRYFRQSYCSKSHPRTRRRRRARVDAAITTRISSDEEEDDEDDDDEEEDDSIARRASSIFPLTRTRSRRRRRGSVSPSSPLGAVKASLYVRIVGAGRLRIYLSISLPPPPRNI